MHPFEGFLEGVARTGDSVVARFVVGGFDPSPSEPPVLLLKIEQPNDIESLCIALNRLIERDAGSYVSLASATEAHIHSDHGNELTIVGKSVSVAGGQFEARDFERLAKQNHDWGRSQTAALKTHTSRLAQLRALLRDQHSRISAKLQGHEPGSTARTLYEQHLSFISRALAESEA